MLYANELVIISDTIKDLTAKVSMWRRHLKGKGFRVNMKKVMYSAEDLDVLTDAGRWPCGVYGHSVGNNSIMFPGCHHWIHKSCSGVKDRLTADPSYRC